MYTVEILNDYCHGPIWVYDKKGRPSRYSLIDDDIYLQKLNEEGKELYDSFFNFQTCEFSYEKEKANKDKMLSIVQRILKRLNEINDGTFVVEDYVTEHTAGHLLHFINAYGLNEKKIPSFLEKVIKKGKYTMAENGRARIYQIPHKKPLLVVIGDNGYLVTAYPYTP